MPFHEVAHQWWGNVAGSAEYRDAWIQEAMANYLALLYADTKRPADQRMKTWLDHYRSVLTTKAPGTGMTLEAAGPLSFGWRLSVVEDAERVRSSDVREGHLGDSHASRNAEGAKLLIRTRGFEQLLKAILGEHRFAALSTADFQRAIEQQMTPAMDLEGTHSMAWFFDEWVRGTGIPQYSVEFQVKPHGREFLVTGKLKQSGVDDVFTAADSAVRGASGRKDGPAGRGGDERRRESFRFMAKAKPTHIVIDPRLTVLCRTE